MSRTWIVPALALVVTSPALAAQDYLESLTAVGSDAIIQGFRARRHIMKPAIEDKPGSHQRRRELELDQHGKTSVVFPPPKPTAWSWKLEYGFTRSTRDETAESTHSFAGGMEWEALDDLDIAWDITVESIPTENLRTGAINLSAAYLFELEPEPELEPVRDEAATDDDAPEYKKRFGRPARPLVVGAENDGVDEDDDDAVIDEGPTLLGRLLWSWRNHQKQPASLVDADTLLEERWAGLEAVYTPHPAVSWRFMFTHHFYDQEHEGYLDDFVARFASPAGYDRLRLRRSPVTGLFSPQRGFPLFSVELSGAFYPSDWWELFAGAARTAYKPSGSNATLNLGGAAWRSFPVSRWKIGGGLDLSLSSGSSAVIASVALAYKL
jgi:hypothetical protein